MPPSAPQHSPFRAAELAFALIGLGGLAVISLAEPASSLIHATPWRFVYLVTLLSPVFGLCARLCTGDSWRPPARTWSLALVTLAGSVFLSACLSPYRSIVFWWSAPALSGIAVFLWLHARITTRDGARETVARGLALAVGLLVLRSMGSWTQDAIHVLSHGSSFQALMDIRNAHPLGHSNYTAGAVILGLPWVVRAVARSSGYSRYLWVVITVLSLATLFTSGSRGGIIGLAVLAGLGLLMLRLPRRQRLWCGVGLIVMGIGFALTNPRVRATLQPAAPSSPPNLSSVQRSAMLEAGWKLGAQRPIWGWGLHSTPLTYPLVREELDGGAENVLQLHSAPVELWAGLGTIGVVTIVALLALALNAWRREPTAAAALVGYGVFSLTDYQLDLPIIVSGIAATGAMLAPPGIAQWGRRRRWGLAAVCLGLFAILILGGERDPTPQMNSAALQIAKDPARTPEAIALLQKSLQRNHDQEIAHFNLGWLLLVSDPAQAEWHFRRAARLVPDKGGVYFGLGLARLNQGRPSSAAYFFALECINEPRFQSSPWWTLPALSAQLAPTKQQYIKLLKEIENALGPNEEWRLQQQRELVAMVDRMGNVSDAGELAYRRERTGYPVLMRNLDIPPPIDLYDVRENRSGSDGDRPPPPKGWLPGPLLLNLLDASEVATH